MSKKGLMISDSVDQADFEDGDISEDSNESKKKGK